MSTPNQLDEDKQEAPSRVQRPDRPQFLLVGSVTRWGELLEAYRSAEYEVQKAVDAQEAHLCCRATPPHLVVIDTESVGDQAGSLVRWLQNDVGVPAILMLGPPAHEQVALAVSLGVAGYVITPVSVGQLLATTEIALIQGLELQRLKESEQQLSKALAQGRETSTAVGVLMERYRLTEREAFERLRGQARSQRRKMAALAKDVVVATEVLNQPAARNRRDP